MPKSPEREQKIAELVKKLLDQKLISAPQADIAKADAEVTGMTVDEVLIARRWVQEETLFRLAPWLRGADQQQESTAETAAVENRASDWQSSDDFDDNLQKYRDLMEAILGEADK